MNQLRNESGMTLIEMLIAMAVLGIIIGPITGSLVLGLGNMHGTTETTSDSFSAQLLSLYWERDVASSETLTLTAPGAGCSGEGRQWFKADWTDPQSTPVAMSARYIQPCNSTILQRILKTGSVDGTPQELMSNFSGVTFVCAPNVDCSNVRSVTATFTTSNPTTDKVYASSSISLSAVRRQN